MAGMRMKSSHQNKLKRTWPFYSLAVIYFNSYNKNTTNSRCYIIVKVHDYYIISELLIVFYFYSRA